MPVPDIADLEDRELQQILRHLNRNTTAGRQRIAGDPATRAYLQAGVRLLCEAVLPSARPEGESPDEHAQVDNDPVIHPFLEWISRRRVVDEVANEQQPELPKQASPYAMRDRWDPHQDFISDLLLVALLGDAWTKSMSNQGREFFAEFASVPFTDVVREFTYHDMVTLVADPAYRVSLLAYAISGADPIAAEGVTRQADFMRAGWVVAVEAILEQRGRVLRPGITSTMVAEMLNAVAHGGALRLLPSAEDSPELINHETHDSVVGTAILAILCSVTEPIEDRDGLDFAGYADATLNT